MVSSIIKKDKHFMVSDETFIILVSQALALIVLPLPKHVRYLFSLIYAKKSYFSY